MTQHVNTALIRPMHLTFIRVCFCRKQVRKLFLESFCWLHEACGSQLKNHGIRPSPEQFYSFRSNWFNQ